MNLGTISRAAALRPLALAALLAGAATAASAADASLSIAWFGVSAAPFSGSYVWATNPTQSFSISAVEGPTSASGDYAAADWAQGDNHVAQTGNVSASGNTVTFTDPMTQLATAGTNLSATAVQTPGQSNVGNATASQSGTFSLIDSDGNAVAGSLTFDVYYDFSVTQPAGAPANYASTAVSLVLTTSSGATQSFSDGLLSSALPGGMGSNSGHFTWTLDLAAGETASYVLNTGAIAAAVPEPGSYALLAAGLLGMAAWTRRQRRA